MTLSYDISLKDPYVKVWLQFSDKRIEKRKTPIFKCTLNPIFNESFSFNVPWEKIRECSLDIMVMDFDNIGRNELIGRILLAGKSLDSSSMLSMTLWNSNLRQKWIRSVRNETLARYDIKTTTNYSTMASFETRVRKMLYLNLLK